MVRRVLSRHRTANRRDWQPVGARPPACCQLRPAPAPASCRLAPLTPMAWRQVMKQGLVQVMLCSMHSTQSRRSMHKR
jgi:hypothetical protein